MNFLPMVRIVFVLIFFCLSVVVMAQDIHDSNPNAAEKVYLQLDGKVYTTGNTVWFKAIVLSVPNHVPSSLSGVLHVELINSDKKILQKKLIKLEKGIGQGFIDLELSYSQGAYLVRTYTNWNKNFGADFIFEEYIQVFTNRESGKEKPIADVKLIKETSNENRLKASFNPVGIDSLHNDKLKIFITLDDKKDSLYLKKNENNRYQLDYPLSGESKLVTLQMQTENHKEYATTIVLDQEYIDLQFLPESGELVNGLSAKVGFKALDAKGKGKLVQGDIVDDQDSVIASFKSNVLGMGSFLLDKPDSTKQYYARITTNTPEIQTLLYPLPKVAQRGNVLSVERQDEYVLLKAQSNYLASDSIYLTGSFRGVSLFDTKEELKQGVFKLRIPHSKLPEGIICFTMLDDTRQPVAERLYFNERPETRIHINITADKEAYKKRELTNLTIETKGLDSEPLSANLSLLVIDKQQLGQIQQQRQNILSYFLLDSELRGEIENSGFYFNKDSSMHRYLDDLMITQGWRKYNYSKEYKDLTFQPEPNLTVSGQVSGLLSKRKRDAELTLMTFGPEPSVYAQVADSLGNFLFNIEDEYGQSMNVVIQSAKSSGKKMNYSVTLDKKVSPAVDCDKAKTVVELDSVVDHFIAKDQQRNKVEEAFSVESGSILLDEVEVTDSRLTTAQKKVIEAHGNPDLVIDGKSIEEKEEKWSYGLYSVLRANFPEKIAIVRGRDGNLYAKVKNSAMTLFVVDGIPVKPYEYLYLPDIPPSEVSSVEVFEYADNFIKLFCEMSPLDCAYAPPYGNIIAIYTYAQKGLHGVKKPVGIVHASVPVFTAPREFYAPKYGDNQSEIKNKPDLRALIHWEPEIHTDSLGKASASFYNGDNVGKVMVVVEAISENGAIGYQEIEYEIEGKETIIVEK